MKILGLTGGIGMGKSTVAEALACRGIPIVDTDRLARVVVEPGQPAHQEVQEAFGVEVFDSQGGLRREELARRVFAKAQERRKLESILHPRIRERWQTAVSEWRKQGVTLGVVVIPLLFETGAESEFDAVMCVACSAGIQHQRLAVRHWSAEEINQRIQAQWPVEKKIHAAHYVLWNDSNREVVEEQLDRVLRRISVSTP